MTADPPQFDAVADIQLEVPGEDTYLEVLRSVSGRAARIKGFSFDGIEDYTLAVDEAAVLLLDHKPRTLRLVISRLRDHGPLTSQIYSFGEQIAWPPPELESDTRWQILDAICESVWVAEPAGIGLAQSAR